MRRYIFAAEFASPQEGPRFDLVPPFDKCEVVQGDATVYPAPDTCLVSVECQRHTALVDATDTDGAQIPPDPDALADLEAAMEAARADLATRYSYIGQEDVR